MADTTEGFYTLKGYQLSEHNALTSAMEDYLEMICRLQQDNGKIRVVDLSKMLHVRPSSVTKMVQHLVDSGYICAEKYGLITLTKKGAALGNYLLYRHDVLDRFLCILNGSDSELEQVEKIEHFLNRLTVSNLDKLTKKLSATPL